MDQRTETKPFERVDYQPPVTDRPQGRHRRPRRKIWLVMVAAFILAAATYGGLHAGGPTGDIARAPKAQPQHTETQAPAPSPQPAPAPAAGPTGDIAQPAPKAAGTKTVTYTITSNASLISTSWNSASGTGSVSSTAPPWSTTESGQFVFESVVARAVSFDGNTISCTIEVDKVVVAHNTGANLISCYYSK